MSTWFFYDLRRRYAVAGEAALEPRSRAPHRVANRTSDALEDLIVATRKDLDRQGLDAGAATIHTHLRWQEHAVPSESTIWRVLSRRGFIVPQPQKAPKRSQRRFAAERANECWQCDDTGWELRDETPVKIINVLDDCTRVLVAARVVPTATAAAVFDAFAHGADEWGWPERILCDNAKAHHALTDTFAALGITMRHSRVHHPQTCGTVERVHQTETQYLDAHPAAETIDELQTVIDQFRFTYNHRRPHRAHNRQIPAVIWNATPKSGPATRPLNTPTCIYRAVANHKGIVDAGSRYQINLGVAHAHEPAIIVITGIHCHVFVHGRLARALTLDPTRRSQPLHPRQQP